MLQYEGGITPMPPPDYEHGGAFDLICSCGILRPAPDAPIGINGMKMQLDSLAGGNIHSPA